jgi:hypothetical protein
VEIELYFILRFGRLLFTQIPGAPAVKPIGLGVGTIEEALGAMFEKYRREQRNAIN